MIKKGLSFLLVLALVFSLLPAVGMGAEASEGTYYSYEDIVERTYDLSYLAKDPLPGEGGKQITSTDPSSQYNEATGKYENWDANLDNSGYVRYEDGWRVIADLEGPGYMTRFWIPTLWHGRMQLFIDGEMIYEGSTTEFIWGECFSEYSELSFQANYHDTEQFGPGYLGGIDLFVPITYNESLKIRLDVGEGNAMYYNLCYYELEDGATVESFSWPMSEETKALLKEANDILLDETAPAGNVNFNQSVDAGETVTLFESATPGALTSLAMDIDIPEAEFDPQTSLVDWVITMYWDGSAQPAVCLPVADFFGIHYGNTAFDNAAYGLEEDGTAYCGWYMPFSTAKITLTNKSDTARNVSVSMGTETLTAEEANSLTRFHVNWQRSHAREDDRWPEAQLVSITGKGRYVGTSLHLYQYIDGIWWGEGDEKFYIDGEKYPTWFGTGSEDYFCYAWCGSMLFDYPYCGQPHNDGYPATGDKQVQGHGDKVNYRMHITDSIVFNESFEANIEKYHNDTSAQYAATTYFYLTEGTSSNHVAVEPSAELRLFNNDVLTAPALFYPGSYISSRLIDSNTSVAPWLQPMDQFNASNGEWYGDLNYMWPITAKGKYLNFLLDIPEGGKYDFNVSMTVAPDYGTFEFYLDDVLMGTADCYHSSVDLKTFKLGQVNLTPGAHTLKILCSGKSLSSSNYIMGLNYLEFASLDETYVPTESHQYFKGSSQLLGMVSSYDGAAPGDQGLDTAISDDGSHFFWLGGVGNQLDFAINAPKNGYYDFTIAYTSFVDFGKYDVLLDGAKIGEYDSYSATLAVNTVVIEDVAILEGDHLLSFRCTGKNDASVGVVMGLDYIQMDGISTNKSIYQDVSSYYRGSADLLAAMTEYTSSSAPIDQGLNPAITDDGSHLFWHTSAVDASLSFQVSVPQTTTYALTVGKTCAGDFGIFDVFVDGNKVGTMDSFSGAIAVVPQTFKNIDLTAGEHTLTFTCVGKNNAAWGTLMGIDYLRFDGVIGDKPFVPVESSQYFKGSSQLLGMVSSYDGAAPGDQGLDTAISDDGSHFFWLGGVGNQLDFAINAPENGYYDFTIAYTSFVDFGKYDVLLDGAKIGEYDSYSTSLAVNTVVIEDVAILEGDHLLSFRCTGKNDASAGVVMGLDYIQMDGISTDDIITQDVSSYYRGSWDLLPAVSGYTSAEAPIDQGVDIAWGSDDGSQLFWHTAAVDTSLSFTVSVPKNATYALTVNKTCAGDFGIFDVFVDSNKVGTMDSFSAAICITKEVFEGIELTAGEHTLTFTCVGKNDSAWGTLMGIDYLRFDGQISNAVPEVPGEEDPDYSGLKLSDTQKKAMHEIRAYAEEALKEADDLQKPYVKRAMAEAMLAISAAEDSEVATLLSEAKMTIDTVLTTTYEEELEIDLLDDLFYEGAEMPTKVSSYTSNVEPHGQGMGAAWSGSGHMFWPANENGEMCVTIHVPYAATYTGSFAYTLAGDFGIYDVYLDDIKILEGIDSYAATISVKSVDFGEINLTEGDHVLKIVITGKNSASANYYMAIDHLILSGINEVIQYRASACKYLDSYKLEEDYSPEQWQVLQAVIAEQKAIINGCATVDDVIAAWKNAKAVIDAVDTGLVDYENMTFDAAKTPADFGWHSDDDNYTNWQTTADGRTFFISYPGSDSQRIWKDLFTDPDNFTLTAEVKVGEKRAYMELFGVTIELNCENGNGNQIFDKENWAWFDAEDQICFVTISRVEGGDLNITLSGKGNATEVSYTKPVADDTNTNFFFGLWDAGASAYISDIAVTGVEAQTVDNFGWDTDEIGGSKDFSGWTSLDGTDITAVYADTTGNHRIWKGLVEDQNNFTVYADITALTESSAYIKLLGQTLELDARNGNGAQLGVKLNGTFRDWIAAENLHAQVYLTRVDGGDIAVTIVTNGKTTKAEYTLSPSESSENVELGIYAGTVTFADLAVTEPETEVEVLKNPGDFGWESDSEDFSGWTATNEANLSVTYDQTVNGRVWKGLLTVLNNFTIDLDVTNDNSSSTYIKVLGMTIELDSNNGDGNQTFMKVGGRNYDWLAGNGCKFHVTIARSNGGDLTVTVTGEGNETPFTATVTPTENNENVELGLYRGISKFENITVVSGEAEPTEVTVKVSHTVSFDSDLQMNYRIKLADIMAAVPNYVTEGAYLTVEKDRYPMGGGEKTVETVTLYPDLTTDAERMLFNLAGIQSVEMGSELRAVLHFFDENGNEYYTTVDTYSVLAYAELCFDYYDPAKDAYLFTMLIDCLNYGAAAQVAFDRRADELVNAGLEAYQQYASTELSAELTDVRTYVDNDRTITAVTKMGFTVVFADKTEINAKLTVAEGYTKEDITSVKVLNESGEEVAVLTEFTELDDGRLQVTFTGVKSVNMRDMYYFVAYVGDQVASQNVGYSIEAYAKSNIASTDANAANLAKACIYYGDSAKIYFDSLTK